MGAPRDPDDVLRYPIGRFVRPVDTTGAARSDAVDPARRDARRAHHRVARARGVVSGAPLRARAVLRSARFRAWAVMTGAQSRPRTTAPRSPTRVSSPSAPPPVMP